MRFFLFSVCLLVPSLTLAADAPKSTFRSKSSNIDPGVAYNEAMTNGQLLAERVGFTLGHITEVEIEPIENQIPRIRQEYQVTVVREIFWITKADPVPTQEKDGFSKRESPPADGWKPAEPREPWEKEALKFQMPKVQSGTIVDKNNDGVIDKNDENEDGTLTIKIVPREE